MRNGSHVTWIALIREHVEAWRKEQGWSRETVSQNIVEAHALIDGDTVTGIKFDPPSRDTFERAKANADRIFRWLDDVTKDNNHLPVNFLPSILLALPMERRMTLVNSMLRRVDLAGRALPKQDDGDSTVMLFKGLVNVSAKAGSAMADLLDGVDPGELQTAQAALAEAHRTTGDALAKVEIKLGAEVNK